MQRISLAPGDVRIITQFSSGVDVRDGVSRWRQGHALGGAPCGAAVIAPAFLLLALCFLGFLSGLGSLRQWHKRGSLYREVRSERRRSTHSSGSAASGSTVDTDGSEVGSTACPCVLPRHRLRQWHAGFLVLCQSTLWLTQSGDACADTLWQRSGNAVVVVRGFLGEAWVLLALHATVVPSSSASPILGAAVGLLEVIGCRSRLLSGVVAVGANAVLLEEQALGLRHELVHTLGPHRAHLIRVGLLAMQANGTKHLLRDAGTLCCCFLSSVPCWVFV